MTDAAPAGGSPPGSPPPGSSPPGARGTRLFAWLFGAAGVGVLLCCAGGLNWANGIEKTDDPDRVREIAASLVAVELPPRFTPEQALFFPSPPVVGWFREMSTRMAAFGTALPDGTAGGGQLILSRKSGGALPDAADATERMTDATVRAVTIADGRAVPFAFGSTGAVGGTGEPGGERRREVRGAFAGPDGAVYLLQLALPPAEYDEAEVTALLESLGPPGS